MAKEMNVSCDFSMKQQMCDLPDQMMDVLLKVRTKTESTHSGKMFTLIC